MMKFMRAPVAEQPKLKVVNVRLPEGMEDRIDRLLYGGELRSAFIRRAVITEIQRRERETKK